MHSCGFGSTSLDKAINAFELRLHSDVRYDGFTGLKKANVSMRQTSQSPLAISRDQVVRATGRNPWDMTNEILYDLCQKYPDHTNQDAVLTKIHVIGRIYAAAIERRKNKKAEETNDTFYISSVVPALMASELDQWICRAKAVEPNTQVAMEVMVEAHGRTTELFKSISDLEKRSLASKYLHFHVPDLFYIYDSRAAKALRGLHKVLGKQPRYELRGDAEYQKFVGKCALLKSLCETRFGISLSPRQLDTLLLAIAF